MSEIKQHLKKQLVLFFALLVGMATLPAQLHAYVLIDNFDTAEITQCISNPFGLDVAIQGRQYQLIGSLSSETRHPHQGYCERNYYYGLGRENDFRNEAGSNLANVISLFRTYWLNQVVSLNVVGDSSIMTLVYDGIDNNPVTNSFGLSGVDFTNDNVLRLRISTSNNDSILEVNLYKDDSNFSSVSLTMPNSDNAFEYLDIQLSEFEELVNITGTGVDLSDVKSIEFILNNVATAAEEDDSDVLLAQLVPDAAAYGAVCSAVGVTQCSQRHFGLGVDNIEVTKQLSHTMSAAIVTDVNSDGDIDSAADLEDTDTFRYTVTITNTDDLLNAPVTELVYTASFAPNYASFIVGSVTTSLGTVNLGNLGGDISVEVSIPTLADGETVTITYDMQVDAGWQDTANIAYSHFGTLDANEWSPYNLAPVIIEFNEFDINATLTAAALDDADSDGYSGEGERVRFTAILNNEGPDPSDSVVFDFDAIPNASLVSGSVTTNKGSITEGNGANHKDVKVSISNFASNDQATITFDLLINEPFFFAEFDSIIGQALITNSGQFYFGLSDDPNVGGNQDPTRIFVDAFPNRSDAHLDGDGDGLPENCNPACDDEDPFPNDTDNDGTTNDPENPIADDDGDGVPNGDDVFPFQCEASLDTDEDGKPDELIFGVGCIVQSAENSQLIEDDDDDNDGTLDVDDDFPLNNAADTDTDGDARPDVWLETCNVTCQNNSGLTLDTDDDNDLVLDVNDAFPLNNAASVDADADGFPDAWNAICDLTCQTNSGLTLDPFVNDTDNDGVINSQDAFPTNCSASVDTDMDGEPDFLHDPLPEGCVDGGLTADTDDDDDGVLDIDDAFPLNIAASVDEDQDGLPDAWNDGTGGTFNCDLNCQNESGLTLDLFLNDTDNDGVPNDPDNAAADDDGDGILNGDEEPGFELIDNNPPVVTPPANRTVTASGTNTTVILGFATATDVVQGLVVNLSQSRISASDKGPFAVGVHTITWSAVDAAGNIGTATQTVTVKENPDLTDDGESSGGGGSGSFGMLSVFSLLLFLLRQKLVLSRF